MQLMEGVKQSRTKVFTHAAAVVRNVKAALAVFLTPACLNSDFFGCMLERICHEAGPDIFQPIGHSFDFRPGGRLNDHGVPMGALMASMMGIALAISMVVMALLLLAIIWESNVITYQRDLIRAIWSWRYTG